MAELVETYNGYCVKCKRSAISRAPLTSPRPAWGWPRAGVRCAARPSTGSSARPNPAEPAGDSGCRGCRTTDTDRPALWITRGKPVDRPVDRATDLWITPVDATTTVTACPGMTHPTDRCPPSAGGGDQPGPSQISRLHVASLARPGGNATGMTMLLTDLVAKELEVFKEALPQARRFGVLFASTAPSHVPALEAAETAARQLAVALRYAPVRSESDLRDAIPSMARDGVDGLMVFATPLMVSTRARIAELAIRHRLPSVFGAKDNVLAGGLMSYAPTFSISPAGLRATSTEFSRARDPPTCRWSRRPDMSLRSTSTQPRRSASRSRLRSSPAPMR